LQASVARNEQSGSILGVGDGGLAGKSNDAHNGHG
jgi:hypothetical protein